MYKRQLSASGSRVVCASRRLEELQRVSNAINALGGKSIAVQTDITLNDQCQNMVKKTIDSFGQIDGLVLNDMGNGIVQGIKSGDTVRAVLNYGDGIIFMTSEMTSLFTSGSVTAQYIYNPLILESVNTNTFTGKLIPETVYGLSSTSILNEDVNTKDHGFIFMVTNPSLSIDSIYWSLGTAVSDVFKFDLRSQSLEPYDYFITFYDNSDSLIADTSAVGFFRYNNNGDDSFFAQRTPISIYNMTLGQKVWSYNIRRAQEKKYLWWILDEDNGCLLYTSPSPRDRG